MLSKVKLIQLTPRSPSMIKKSGFSFCYLPEKNKREIKDEYLKLKQLDEKVAKSYEPYMFKLFNSRVFLEKLAILTRKEEKAYMGFNLEQYLRNLQIPIILLIFLLLFWFIWVSVPYTVVFKHLSISEYTVQKHYWHTLLTSCLSIQKTEDFLIYFPQALLALTLLPKNLGSMHFSVSFLINTLVCGGATVLFYYHLKEKDELLVPKFCGSNTCCFFMSMLSTIRTDINLFKRAVPLWIIPLTQLGYEIYQLRRQVEKQSEKNVSHLGNIIAILNGFVLGTVLKKKFQLFDL